RFRFVPILATGILLTGALAACSDQQQQQQQQGQQQAAQVEVYTVTPESVNLSVDLPGRTAAYRVAQVRPQVSGVLLKRNFEEGTFVEKGQQLYQIDPAVYEAELASAE
ncbi:biotin/lipoyl-binding protein, partial [Idiomarina sp.]